VQRLAFELGITPDWSSLDNCSRCDREERTVPRAKTDRCSATISRYSVTKKHGWNASVSARADRYKGYVEAKMHQAAQLA